MRRWGAGLSRIIDRFESEYASSSTFCSVDNLTGGNIYYFYVIGIIPTAGPTTNRCKRYTIKI